jgi:hypothetical protein
VTTSVCPAGWTCQAERAPGSKVTDAADTRDGSATGKIDWTRTVPVKYSAGPGAAGCAPLRVTIIFFVSSPADAGTASKPSATKRRSHDDLARMAFLTIPSRPQQRLDRSTLVHGAATWSSGSTMSKTLPSSIGPTG